MVFDKLTAKINFFFTQRNQFISKHKNSQIFNYLHYHKFKIKRNQ